jgi:putative transposase
MNFILQPWQLLVVILTGWLNRQQQAVIDFLLAEVQVLKEAQGKRRIRLSDDQRCLLAIKGKALGRKALQQITTIVTPDTILRWHRQLVAAKWDYSERRRSNPGRPPVSGEITQLILRMAQENPSWGYDRIQGALANLGRRVSSTTVSNVLKAHGFQPAPRRKRQSTWKTFIKAHWDVLATIDFTTVEVWTPRGLVTYYLLFVMELSSRRVCWVGCTRNPNEAWMKQIARNLTDPMAGILGNKRYLLMDRDTKYSQAFRLMLKHSGIECIRLPPRSPNLTPHIERFMRTIKDECLSRMIFFGERSLQNAVADFLAHYHRERNHQGMANRILEPGEEVGRMEGRICCRQRLGGMLRYYYRNAA